MFTFVLLKHQFYFFTICGGLSHVSISESIYVLEVTV